MRPKIYILIALAILLSCQSCVIMQSGELLRKCQTPETSNSKSRPLVDKDFDTALAVFQNLSFASQADGSLHVTVVNYKTRLIAEVDITEITPFDLRATIGVRNFEKTEFHEFQISCPINLFSQLNVGKTSGNNYKITQGLEKTDRACFLTDVSARADLNGVVYFYDGLLVTNTGSEVNFWAQTDPAPPGFVFGAAIIGSNLMDAVNWKVNICIAKIGNAILQSPACNGKRQISVTYSTKPLSEIFYGDLWRDFYLDCIVKKVECKKAAQ